MTALLRSVLTLALGVLPLAAQPGPDQGPRQERGGRVLNLTEAQRASIRAIRDKHHQDLTLRRDAVKHAQIDLRTALQDSSIPEPRLRSLYDKAAAARFDMILARRSMRLEVQAVLTPKQRAQAAEMRGSMHHRPVDASMAG